MRAASKQAVAREADPGVRLELKRVEAMSRVVIIV